jgi:Fe(3+) dicitrate transport protein
MGSKKYMNKPMRKLTATAVMLAFAGASAHVFAEDSAADAEKIKIDAVTVKGILPDQLESVPGSFDVVTEKAIEERRPFSMQEALNNVPGINVVGENAFGLGINIGVRGLDPRRTSRTLLMEDGMPLFLAPYGDPAAHYTTPIELIDRIEVVKGSGQVLYGPQTVGGMINFVTKPIPTNGFAGSVTAKAGSDDFVGGHMNIGYGNERGGFMIDALQNQGDGIRKNHEFEQQDFRIKGQINLTERQTLIGKIGYYKEDSNISETGLSRQEYREDKYQASTGKNDKFEMDRKVAQLQHIFQVDDRMKLSTLAYYANTERASMRQVASPGNWDDEAYWGQGDAYSTLAHCPTGEEEEAVTTANAANCGGQWRPRKFTYWGIEPRLDLNHKLFGIENDLVAGFRYHKENIDRKGFRGYTPAFRNSLSYAKSFTGIDQATYDNDDDGIPDGGFDGYFREHIKTEVTAMSYYLQNTFHAGNWSITPGLRFEDVKVRTNVIWAEGEAQGIKDTNRYSELLPGLGLAWNGIENTTFFAGVHKGFAPPRPDRDLSEGQNGVLIDNTKPEESTNWEVGVRTKYFKGIHAQATLFHTDFDEIVIKNGGRFENGGKSLMQGLELAGRVDFGTIFDTPHNFYVTGSYTNLFTAKFKKDAFQSNEDIEEAVNNAELNSNAARFCSGDSCQYINNGSRLPYAPKHIASLNFGYSHPIGINARIGADYVSEQEPDAIGRLSDPVTGTAGKIPSYTLVNASVSFKPQGSKATLFLSGHNLADKEYLASRVDGMVAGRGRMVFGGIRYDF